MSCVKVVAELEERSAITVMATDTKNGDVPTVLPLDEYKVIIIECKTGLKSTLSVPFFSPPK